MSFLIKPQLLAAVLSLSALSMTAEAATRAETRRSSYGESRDETLDVLKQLSLQMREMQEQISALKSTQNSLTSETMVKNLAPKVRRIEMQVDYLEKRFRDQPSYLEVKAVLSEHNELKKQIDSLAKGSFANSDDTIQAISPVLARMQKQLLFLYDKYKKGGAQAQGALTQSFAKLKEDISSFQKHAAEQQADFSTKLTTLQQAMGSIGALKQNLAGNSQAMAEIQAKVQLMAQDLTKFNGVVEQIGKFKEQVAHNGSLQVKAITQLNNKMNDLANDDRFRQMAERSQALETSMQQLQEKSALLIGNQKALWEKSKKMPGEEFFSKQRNLETSLSQLQSKLSELGGFLSRHEQSFQEMANFKTEVSEQWQKSIKALVAVNNRVKQTTQDHKELKETVNQQISSVNDKLAKIQEFYMASNTGSQEPLSELSAKTSQLEEKVSLLQQQNQVLYARLKDLREKGDSPQSSPLSLQKELQALKQQSEQEAAALKEKFTSGVSELNERLQALNEAHSKTLEDLRFKIDEMNKSVVFGPSDGDGNIQHFFQEELKKRDEEIAKLKRRVLHLYKNSRDEADGKVSSNQLDERFEALKKDMESRILEHLEKNQKDQQVIENLSQKVAELQSLLPERSKTDLSSNED